MPEKKERLKIYDLSLRHPSLAQFRNRPFGFQSSIHIAITLLSIYMVATVPAIIYCALSKSPYKDAYGMALLLVCIALSMWIAYPFIVKLAFKSMLAEMNEAPEIARRPEGAVCYVGVIYFKGIAILDQIDTAWDRGWLSIESGFLVYRGINSQFRLPLAMVKSVGMVTTNASAIGHSPRVAVQWSHPEGTDEHFVVEIRDAKSKKDCQRRIELLVGRIGDAIRLHATELEFEEKELPFRSTVAEQAKNYVAKVLSGEDFAIAFVYSSVIFALLAGLYVLGLKAIGSSYPQYLYFPVVGAPGTVISYLALGWRKAKRLREDVSSEG